MRLQAEELVLPPTLLTLWQGDAKLVAAIIGQPGVGIAPACEAELGDDGGCHIAVGICVWVVHRSNATHPGPTCTRPAESYERYCWPSATSTSATSKGGVCSSDDRAKLRCARADQFAMQTYMHRQ